MYDAIMEEVGKPIVFNICMLGAMVGLTRLVKPESIMRVLSTRVPEEFLEMNQKAMEIGLRLAESSQ